MVLVWLCSDHITSLDISTHCTMQRGVCVPTSRTCFQVPRAQEPRLSRTCVPGVRIPRYLSPHWGIQALCAHAPYPCLHCTSCPHISLPQSRIQAPCACSPPPHRMQAPHARVSLLPHI